MQDPDREKCRICQKLLKKTSMKKHIANVHGKAAQDKKKLKDGREVAKKKALQQITSETSLKLPPLPDYSLPKEVNDEKLEELRRQLEDFTFIDVDWEKDETSSSPVKIKAETKPLKKKREQPELAIQKKLEKQYNAGHKNIPYGIIDILGKDFFIEIKNWNDWIKAIGQVTVYGNVYPNHMKHIHFFGEVPPADKEIYIRAVCAKLGIKVTAEHWP